MAGPVREQLVKTFVAQLAGKGGGAAAAVAASLGAASGAMAAVYSVRKRAKGSAMSDSDTEALADRLDAASRMYLSFADKDSEAYGKLQRTWKKDHGMSADEVAEAQRAALEVPASLVRLCHEEANAVREFLPDCNPNIRSDARVAIHLLAGAARAAYQTVEVNKPSPELECNLLQLLRRLSVLEQEILPEAQVSTPGK